MIQNTVLLQILLDNSTKYTYVPTHYKTRVFVQLHIMITIGTINTCTTPRKCYTYIYIYIYNVHVANQDD